MNATAIGMATDIMMMGNVRLFSLSCTVCSVDKVVVGIFRPRNITPAVVTIKMIAINGNNGLRSLSSDLLFLSLFQHDKKQYPARVWRDWRCPNRYNTLLPHGFYPSRAIFSVWIKFESTPSPSCSPSFSSLSAKSVDGFLGPVKQPPYIGVDPDTCLHIFLIPKRSRVRDLR